MESPPISIMINAMTVEKTGRSMKKLNTVTFDDLRDPIREWQRQGAYFVYVVGAAGAGPATGGLDAGAVIIGLTWAPERSLPIPSTTTRSPAARPLSTTQSLPRR